MKIDIQEIINNKIKDMEEKKTIEKTIEDTIEKTIVKAITDALDGYSLRRDIEDKISKEVSSVVADIGFTAYNSFISEKVKAITEGVCREDIAAKIQKTFDEMLVVKRDSVKLSEICDKYRDWICAETEEPEKYELEKFYAEIEESKYGWLTFKFAKEEPTYGRRSADNSIEFTVHKNNDDEGTGWIGTSTVYIEGDSINEKLKFGRMSDVELLLINIAYNKTPIIIDIEDEDDIDNYFDIDI